MLTRVIGHDKLAMRANRAPGRALTKKILSLELDTIYLAIPLDFGYRWVSSGWDWPPAENGGLQPKCVLFLSAHQKRAHRKSPFCPRGGVGVTSMPKLAPIRRRGCRNGAPRKVRIPVEQELFIFPDTIFADPHIIMGLDDQTAISGSSQKGN